MQFSNIDMCYKIFYVVGLHPENGRHPIHLFWFSFITLNLWYEMYLEVLLLVEIEHTIAEIIQIGYNITFNFYGVLYMTVLFLKREGICKLVKDAKENFWRIEDMNITESEKNSFIKRHKTIRTLFFTIVSFYVTGIITFFGPSLLAKATFSPFPSHEPAWMPPPLLIASQIFVGVFAEIIPLVSFSAFLISIIVLTHQQFIVVNKEMERLFSTGDRLQHEELRRLLDYHSFLLRYVGDINSTFSGFILGYIVTITVSMCLQMYSISEMASLEECFKAGLTIVAVMLEFAVFLTIPAQELSDEIERLGNIAYFSDWYLNNNLRSIVLMMIANSQRKVSIKVGGLVEINVITGFQITKAMFSYCAFLRTVSLTE